MLTTVMAEASAHAGGIPPIVYAIGTAIVFLLLGAITFSYREVHFRHLVDSDRRDATAQTPDDSASRS